MGQIGRREAREQKKLTRKIAGKTVTLPANIKKQAVQPHWQIPIVLPNFTQSTHDSSFVSPVCVFEAGIEAAVESNSWRFEQNQEKF
jgi:hypothetical protein